METVKLALILLLLLSNVVCQEMDADSWRAGIGKNKWPNSEAIQEMLMGMTRKPRPRQYLGVIGRKGSEKMQTTRKRHKFQTFVGLMGKRTSDNNGQ
ncbi:protachykinin [Odontesthes bonariensis]|uniref:protachykinin n=1 Tax=Odontesthes bonariensis TaxID=219752 RepID=UPI003F586D97